MTRRFRIPLVALLLVLAAAWPARAGFLPVLSRADLGGTDSVNWGGLGPNFTDTPSPAALLSTGGVAVTTSLTNGSFERRDQGTSWGGNFAFGDALLWNMGNGAITVNFGGVGVRAAGAQIQSDFYGDFVARVTALAQDGTPLASFTSNGGSTPDADNSAAFLGVMSDAANIFQVRFSLDAAPDQPGDFAINKLDFDAGGGNGLHTPEPTTLLLAGVGLVGAVVMRRKRKNGPRGCATRTP